MWRFAKASNTGSSHRKTGRDCDDRVACVVVDDVLVAAVADGAGSASLGARGAELATATLIAHVRSALPGRRGELSALLSEAVEKARECLLSEAQTLGLPPRELSCTLLAVAIGQTAGAAVQIGDGLIAIRQAGDGWCWVFWPQRGEFANATFFLTDPGALERIAHDELSNVADVVMMTDGLEGLALHYQTQTVFSPLLDALISPLIDATSRCEVVRLSDALEGLLASEKVQARTDDDTSVLLATNRSIPAQEGPVR